MNSQRRKERQIPIYLVASVQLREGFLMCSRSVCEDTKSYYGMPSRKNPELSFLIGNYCSKDYSNIDLQKIYFFGKCSRYIICPPTARPALRDPSPEKALQASPLVFSHKLACQSQKSRGSRCFHSGYRTAKARCTSILENTK